MILTKLRGHQEEAYRRAIRHDAFALFMEPRVGKTPVALSVVETRKPTRLLIVCPKVAIPTWEGGVGLAQHPRVDQHLKIDWPCEVRILGIEAASASRKKLERWVKGDPNSMVIVDEGHNIKKRSGVHSRAVRGFGRRCRLKLLLTGTPISQGRQDAWAIFNFLDQSIFGTWGEFREKYLIMGGYFNTKVVGYRNEDEYQKLFHEYSHRLTFAESTEKPVLIRRLIKRFKLSRAEESHYDNLLDDLCTVVNQETVTARRVITQAMKLQQLTGGFLISDSGDPVPVGQSKLDELEAYVLTEDKPFLVVCRFIHEIDRIEERLIALGFKVDVLTGDRKPDLSKKLDCLILQVQSGMSLDLSFASTAVFYSWDYSFINYEQTRFRVLSYHQTRVSYVFLIADGTIDEELYEAVTRKRKLATLVCDRYRREKRD